MPPGNALHHVTAQAVTPDQLLPYVGAVSPMRTSLVGDYALHRYEERAVLVGYGLHECLDEAVPPKAVPPQAVPEEAVPQKAVQENAVLEEAIATALLDTRITHMTVIAAARPKTAPDHAISEEDLYWAVPLPPVPPAQKVRHMLHRAAREVTISPTSGAHCWSAEHAALVQSYIQTRHLEPGTRHIFLHLDAYLAAAPDALLWSAHDQHGHLQACAIGDYSSLGTAFYMFAFRAPTAAPGVADSLLAAVLEEGARRGHVRCNLGLGINASIAFFKKKWHASPFLPCVQTSWHVRTPKKSWFSRFLPL